MAKSKTRKKRTSSAPVNKMEAIRPFITRLHELCDMAGCDAMQHFTSYNEIIGIAKWRFRIGNVNDISSEYNNSNYKARYSKIIKNISKSPIHKVEGINELISLIDFTYLCALTTFLEKDPNRPNESQHYLEQLNNRFSHEKLTGYVNHCIVQASLTENVPDKALCAFDAKVISVHQSTPYYAGEVQFTMRIPRPQKEYVIFNNIKRPAYQVFIPCCGISKDNVFATRKTSALQKLYKGNKDELPIYIQSHAIKRLNERTLPIHPIIRNYGFNTSLLDAKNITIIDRHIYIPYYIHDMRVGYFIAELIDDKILIRTFILATHTSAPEGRKFQTLTGLRKMDMSYWDITSLNTFIYNTMDASNPLHHYFEESGLLPLFNLNNTLAYVESSSKDVNWEALTQCIQKYNQRNTLSNEELQHIDFETTFGLIKP